jgi:hypothetical protein
MKKGSLSNKEEQKYRNLSCRKGMHTWIKSASPQFLICSNPECDAVIQADIYEQQERDKRRASVD